MKNNEWYIRIICALAGLIVGVSATIGVWYYKEVYQFSFKPISKSAVGDFNDTKFWEKAALYYEQDYRVFFDNYETIYGTYSLSNYLDNALAPYYDEYGYDVVLKSGLESGNKMAQTYCVEKCCEIIGKEKINANALLKSLDKVKIDTDTKTNFEQEQKNIDLAEERLELAKALLSQNFASESIAKSDNGKRYAWVSNVIYGDVQFRLLDNGMYYDVAFDEYGYIPKEFKFVNNNILEVEGDPYFGGVNIVCLSERITVFNLDDVVYSYLQEQDAEGEYYYYESSIDADSIKYSDMTVSGDYVDADEGQRYKFTIDAKRGEVVSFDKMD